MYADNGKISNRQTYRLYVFDLIGIGTLLIPPYLAKLAGSDGVFAILTGCLLGYVYLRYLGYIIAKMDTDMGTFLEEKTSKWVKTLSYWFVFIHACLTAGFAVYVFCNLMQYSLVKEVNYYLLLLITIVTAAYSISGGIENRARIYEVLFWFILIPYTVMMLMSVKDFELVYVDHFLESRPVDFAKGIYLVFLFLVPLFFTLFLISKKEKKEYGKEMIKTVSLSLLTAAVVLLGSYVLLLGNFGEKSLATMRFPVITLMSTIQLKGNFLKRMDALMLAVWFFTLFAFLNLHMHYGTSMLKKIVGKARRFELILIAAVTFAVAWLFKNTEAGVPLFLGYYSYVAVPLMVAGPGLILISRKKGKQLAVLLVLFMAGGLVGCSATELESRCFPMMVAVDYDEKEEKVLYFESFPKGQGESEKGGSVNEIQAPVQKGEDFAESKKNFEQTLYKVADYNHLKILVLGEALLENEEVFADMLQNLAKTEAFPRNTYICVTEDIEKLVKIKDELPQEIGTYLEEYMENHEGKDAKLLSLGDLLDEAANREMLLYAPYLKIEESYVEWDGYYTIGENEGAVE